MTEHSLFLNTVLKHAEKIPSKTAIVANSEEITFAQLKKKIFQAVSFLLKLNLKKGDYILLSAQKDIEFEYIYLAAQYIGIINIVADAESNPQKIRYIIDLLKPKYAFGFQFANDCSFMYSDIHFDDLPDVEQHINNGLNESDVADILFTTGTTGLPKGVLLSHHNIVSAINNINNFIGNTSEDVEVIGLPVCHSFGLGRLRCNLFSGSTVVLLGSFANVKLLFKTFEEYKVTGFGMVPANWAYIRKFSGTRITKYANQIRYMEIGSAAMPLAAKKELCELFPATRICMHYGLTESSRTTFLEFHTDYAKLNSIGKPVSKAVDIKIFNDSGIEMPPGFSGELCIRGNMVMKSYYLEEDNSQARFGEYFRTGDWGYSDNEGYLYLESRKKELINVGGKKVSPAEVEDTICSLGIRDCICAGVDDPHKIMGEVVKAFILKENCALSFQEISSRLETLLETYKIPALYEWIDHIPMTASGKKQRLSLK
jgi:long-chain acyl-CoA synthetase